MKLFLKRAVSYSKLCELLTTSDVVRSRWLVGEFCYCSLLALKETMLIKIFAVVLLPSCLIRIFVCFFFQGEDIMDEEYGIHL